MTRGNWGCNIWRQEGWKRKERRKEVKTEKQKHKGAMEQGKNKEENL